MAETQNIASQKYNETHNDASLQNENKFGSQTKNLGSIIRLFKSAVTTYSKIHNINFGRQSRFYEHIIRNEKELNIVREYIINNPLTFDINAKNNPDF